MCGIPVRVKLSQSLSSASMFATTQTVLLKGKIEIEVQERFENVHYFDRTNF